MTQQDQLFPFFEELDSQAAEQSKAEGRASQIHRAWDFMRLCWPDWEGPIVSTDPEDVRGYCSIGAVCAESITYGGTRYSYCVPCRILEISEDRETFIVETAYTNPDCHCYPSNGERWRLDITDLWPPTDRLWKIRNANRGEGQ